MASNWSHALLEQAKADFDAYMAIQNAPGILECHKIQFLQMAVEKLLKGLRSDGLEPPKPEHQVYQKFFNDLGNLLSLSRALGFTNNVQFIRYIKGLKNIIEQLEGYVPTGVRQQENAEYPWETRTLDAKQNLRLDISVPAQSNYQFLSKTDLPNLLKFINDCLAAYGAGKL